MPTASTETTTSAHHSARAARFRILATEADIAALVAIRTDAAKIQRTEEAYRGLIVRQARYLKHARVMEAQAALQHSTGEVAE